MRVPVVLSSLVDEVANFLEDDFFGDDFEEEVEEEEEKDEDPSIQWYHKGYCQVVESMPSACLERSLLELWGEVSLLPSYVDKSSLRQQRNIAQQCARAGEPSGERKVHPIFCSGGQIH